MPVVPDCMWQLCVCLNMSVSLCMLSLCCMHADLSMLGNTYVCFHLCLLHAQSAACSPICIVAQMRMVACMSESCTNVCIPCVVCTEEVTEATSAFMHML